MTEHYYSENPEVNHDQKRINVSFFGKSFSFKTDAGVFSKHKVDFGTTLLIESVHISDNSTVLDLGSGYGPVGITVATLLNKGNVILVDINRRAVELSEDNILLNRHLINDHVTIKAVQSDGFTKIPLEQFDYILLNPPIRAGKTLVYTLFEEAYDHLKDGGEFWIVIQKKQGAPSALKKLQTLFHQVEEVNRKKGYFILKSVK